MNKYTILNEEKDKVAVALQEIKAGESFLIRNKTITILEDIKRGHKFALQDIALNEDIIKYGYPIGHAITEIKIGQWVHTHNIKTNLGEKLSYHYDPIQNKNPYQSGDKRTFMGYKRSNGKVGIRNDLLIVPTVGCILPILENVVAQFKQKHNGNGNFDNIVILKHPYGCSQLGGDHETTKKILVDAAVHPNAAGVLLFGLGCENNQMDGMIAEIEKMQVIDHARMKFIIAQNVRDETEESLNAIEELNVIAKNDFHQALPLSELRIGLKCGGSDGLSGVTANPLLGRLSDFVAAQGGSTVLTEVPEMFGAETILMARAKDEPTFEKVVKLINDFKDYFAFYGQPCYENPSPGNKEGGITTLEDKSLGCTQKSGSSPVNDVLQYGEKIKTSGLSLLQAPGNDLVSSTALASSDCQMVLFTTGRGTPYATYVPTVKISSNSHIADLKPKWIDFNAGRLLETSMDELADEFIQYVIDVASGIKKTNNEINGINGIAIFKNGVTE